MDIIYNLFLIVNKMAKELDLDSDKTNINPIVGLGVEDMEDINNWQGIMYFYESTNDHVDLGVGRLQVVAGESEFKLFPMDNDTIAEYGISYEKESIEELLSAFEANTYPEVEDQIRVLCQDLFSLGLTATLIPRDTVDEVLGSDGRLGSKVHTFPVVVFTHKDSGQNVVINCGPVFAH